MAVTSIWPVKSRLDHVINYARNPAKTRERSLVAQASLHAIDNVIEYAADTIKTEERAYLLQGGQAAENRRRAGRRNLV